MSVQVAVVDPLPAFRQGMLTILGAGEFGPVVPEDVLAWASEAPQRLVFLTLQDADDWALLARLRQSHAEVVVVALLTDSSVQTHAKAILAGAAAAIRRDAPPDAVRQVFEETIRGTSLLPIKVIRALTEPAAGTRVDTDVAEPPSRELEWLRALARGSTVAQLAEQAGYSERAMFRQLHELYARMRVANRTEALIRAQQQGWL